MPLEARLSNEKIRKNRLSID
jgi:hypothetical protein